MADWSRPAPRPPFLGMPVRVDCNLDDGTVLVLPDPVWRFGTQPATDTGKVLVIGTRPLPWVERALREAIHRNLADVYAWLKLPLPALLTGHEILAQLREAHR